MQPCQVCGAIGIDAGGRCAQCQFYRGAESYSVSPPAGGRPMGGSPQASHPDAGGYYYSTASGYGAQAGAAVYPVATSGQVAQSTHNRLAVPLFLLTVIVVVLMSGTVAIVLIRESRRAAPSGADHAQAVPASASAPPASAPPSAASSPSSVVDKCLVGEWTITLWRLPYVQKPGGDVVTSNGGTVRFRADGTGEWDFGSGVRLVGTGPTRTIAIRYTGRITFSFRTVGQTFTFGDVQADVRQETTDSDKVVGAGPWDPRLDAHGYAYACAGDVFRWSPDDPYETRMQRRG
jgi:hypothetical protein